MHTNEPREVEGIDLGYDPRDIQEKGIYRVVAYFFAFALLFFGLGALWYIYVGKVETAQRFDPRKPAIVGPKVQGNLAAKVDIMEMRQTERREMESYGTNKETLADGSTVGRQRIPVAHAMELLAGRGLPVVKNDEKATSPGNTISQNAVGPAGANGGAHGDGSASGNPPGGVTGPAPSSTNTSPAQTPPVPTPDAGGGATGSTGGNAAP